MDDVTQGIERRPIPGPLGANNFKYVKTNVPGLGFDNNPFLEEFAGCSCVDKCDEKSCPCMQLFGPAYNDDGRLLESWCLEEDKSCRFIFECGNNCFCKNGQCNLRVVQRGISVILHVFETESKGYGLKAGDQPSGTGIERFSFVCEYAGEVVDEKEAKLCLNRNQKDGLMNFLIAVCEQTYLSKHCVYVNPCTIGNIGRFINHSCDPNLVMIPVRVNHPVPRLALFARRNICAGEELTFDYSGITSFTFSKSQKDKSCQDSHEQLKSGSASSCVSNSAVKENNFLPTREMNKDYVRVPIDVNEEFKQSCAQVVPDRTKCLCASKNCKGYMPYDENLFDLRMNKS